MEWGTKEAFGGILGFDRRIVCRVVELGGARLLAGVYGGRGLRASLALPGGAVAAFGAPRTIPASVELSERLRLALRVCDEVTSGKRGAGREGAGGGGTGVCVAE
ncbi:hypothetical protein M758_8G057400 [Ceratodon purpureus]|nr:hypothetical protein M758_8G057400 [Ceratodon purpureus]